MERDLRLRLRFTRTGLERALAAALLLGLPTALEPQPNAGQSVTYTFDFPVQPVGAFGSLAVNAGADIQLARNGGRVGVGNIGGGAVLNADLVAMGAVAAGANIPIGGVNLAVPNNPGVRPASLAMAGRNLGRPGAFMWDLRAENLGGIGPAFSHFMVTDPGNLGSAANPRIFSIDPNGSMVLCQWRAVGACPGREVDMFTAGAGIGSGAFGIGCPASGPNNASYCCNGNNNRGCVVPGGTRWRLCCNIGW